MSEQVLSARDVRMTFGGVVALDGASVDVRPGRVCGLIGRNGSGKSTLFNCLTGFLKPTSGHVLLDGRDITGHAPHEVMRAGIARTFQTPRIDFQTTGRDAVLCGLYPQVRHGFLASLLGLPGALKEERELNGRADAVVARMHMQSWATDQVSKLSMGRVRSVEVARAIAADARYLLLDEPAAGIGREEMKVLADEIRGLADRGIGVLLVEHNFSLIRMLCDEVTVLDAGSVIFRGTAEGARRDERVMQLYLGTAAAEAT
ncbi:ABC transporter ATP-binding protein [Caenimonas soli]|uniref:ABC transporter ATP-binding protein n=1 Tax=Caenimonas soli TaxID=2735555 RepID=UPI0015555D28|nr:ABC transporter ATP-binding protein [Caenimonas soli]NPC56389.1 ABC transporter ATP-binding protein [Caenimonas soli]